MSIQSFSLEEEMSFVLETCSRLKVVHKIEILKDHETRPYSKMFFVSVPTREGGWVYVDSLETLVRVLGIEKVARF